MEVTGGLSSFFFFPLLGYQRRIQRRDDGRNSEEIQANVKQIRAGHVQNEISSYWETLCPWSQNRMEASGLSL